MADTYLVTGGAGFIGSNLVSTLCERGHRVRVLDDLSTGRQRNVDTFPKSVEFLHGSILDTALVARAVEGARFVLHQAAIPSVPRSFEDPGTTLRVGVEGTANIFEAARKAKVERVVFASSSSVYGDTEVLPKREDMAPTPLSPYAASKLAGEHLAKIYTVTHGLSVVCLRYFNVFGPRQDPQSQYAAAVPRFVLTMRAGEPPTIFGDGEQSRDFCPIAHVVDANLRACTAQLREPEHVYNVAGGQSITLLQLVDTLNEILGTRIKPVHTAPRQGDVRHSLADVSKARSDLGYQPWVSLRDGLEQTIRWFDEHD